MEKKVISKIQDDKYFSWRGKEVSRTENLSDIVFALALTLIVASSVPKTFDDISALWREGIAIAICFTGLLFIWYAHYLFFRRYDLEDKKTLLLNAVLIFLVMAFVYPLKFLMTFLVNFFTGGFVDNRAISAVLSIEQAPWLTVIYSLGYASVFFIFSLLYRHAYQCGDFIGLSPSEKVMTKTIYHSNLTHVVFAIIVAFLAMTLPDKLNLWAGFFFFFIGIPLAFISNKGEKSAKSKLNTD